MNSGVYDRKVKNRHTYESLLNRLLHKILSAPIGINSIDRNSIKGMRFETNVPASPCKTDHQDRGILFAMDGEVSRSIPCINGLQ